MSALSKLDLNGNQIGEDGCEEIRSLFDDEELLGAFSDDEGSDVDDEEDEGDDDDDDEEESEECDSSVNDSKVANEASNLSIEEVEVETVTSENVCVADVFVCPTKAKLIALDGGGSDSGEKRIVFKLLQRTFNDNNCHFCSFHRGLTFRCDYASS